jgi:hypothetical protein
VLDARRLVYVDAEPPAGVAAARETLA